MLDTRSDAPEKDSTILLVCGEARFNTRIMPAGLAAEGGDWCEAFSLSQDVVALSIGDVSGHGADKFDPMTMIRQVVREAAYAGLPPDAVLATANRFVCTLGSDFLATALFAILDTKCRRLTFANAGHPPPLVVDAGKPTFLSYVSADLALGIESVLSLTLRTETLPPRALLVLYTDGVTERDRDLFRGEQELCAAARFAYNFKSPSAASIIDDLLGLSGPNNDDAALLTVSIPPRNGRKLGNARGRRPMEIQPSPLHELLQS